MTAGSKVGFQPHPIEPSDIESYRQYQNNQVLEARKIFFNDTRFRIPDKKSMDKIYDERNGNRRIKDYVYK
jgi:hypothetical protein